MPGKRKLLINFTTKTITSHIYSVHHILRFLQRIHWMSGIVGGLLRGCLCFSLSGWMTFLSGAASNPGQEPGDTNITHVLKPASFRKLRFTEYQTTLACHLKQLEGNNKLRRTTVLREHQIWAPQKASYIQD